MEVKILPLAPNLPLPVPASASTRAQVPSGYGVQEQCLPFTAATALGFLIPSPFAFGICQPNEVPAGAHPFRSPLIDPRNPISPDEFVFYVQDHPSCQFFRNAFLVALPGGREGASVPAQQPGLSFFDRQDQLDHFKIHLPYLWQTPEQVDALFLPPINSVKSPLAVLSGLVETDWYANPVNLVFRMPSSPQPVHVALSDPLAQVIFVGRSLRRLDLKVLAEHARDARELRYSWLEWHRQHTVDRSAYKKLARSQQGR